MHAKHAHIDLTRLLSSGGDDWRAFAACRDEDPELFWPAHETRVDQKPSTGELEALAVCDRCPVKTACLAWAIDTGEVQWAVAGGLKAADRAVLRWTERAAA